MLEFDLIQCVTVILLLMVAGEVVSRFMKAAIPGVLVTALLYLALVWGGVLDPSIVEKSGITYLTSVAMMCVIINMGASTNPGELRENWRVVALAAISYFIQIGIMLLVIGMLFGRNMAIGSLPGGASVALMVQEKARNLGYDGVVLLSALLLSIKGLFSCPLASFVLKKEVNRVKKLGISTEGIVDETPEKNKNGGQAGERKDGKHESPYMSLLRFLLVAWLASRLEMLCGISRYVFCLLLGVVMTQVGFLHKDEMDRTKSHGMLMLMMMTSILNGFSNATPQMFAQMLIPLACVLITEVGCIFINSMLLGKRFGFSREMGFLVCLNIMVGFPLNLMLSDDIIGFLVEDPKEKAVLHRQIATKMVIAGFTSVTFLSTVTMGGLAGFIK